MNFAEILIGITEVAVALAGFTGVVVVFGSRSEGNWHAGDRLRLGFLLEASLTAGAFSLLALILYTSIDEAMAWRICSAVWAGFMLISLYTSRLKIQKNHAAHGDTDRIANKIVFFLFLILIVVQIFNALYLHQFAPLLAAIILNLAGAAMQFTRLIRAAFHN